MTPLEKLTKLFEKLGAPDPRSWAESQLGEGIPQLARFLFLRQAWRHVIDDGDTSWIDAHRESAQQDPTAPGAGIGLALERLVSAVPVVTT